MKRFLLFLLSILIFFSAGGLTEASLIGDEVEVTYYYSNLDTVFWNPVNVTVEEGTGDVVTFYSEIGPYSLAGQDINIEAESIFVDCFGIPITAYLWIGQFNGIVISDLDDDTGKTLSGVSIDTNLIGWDSSRLYFDDDKVSFNWAGLDYAKWNDTYFNATLNFGSPAAHTPEPATMLLFGAGLAGLATFRKRLRK